MPKIVGFATLDHDELVEVSRAGGFASHDRYEWTPAAARAASLKRMGDITPLRSRKRNGRYEYFVKIPEYGRGRWVTRQRVHQLRRDNKL